MKLVHFTRLFHLHDVLREGIPKGEVPLGWCRWYAVTAIDYDSRYLLARRLTSSYRAIEAIHALRLSRREAERLHGQLAGAGGDLPLWQIGVAGDQVPAGRPRGVRLARLKYSLLASRRENGTVAKLLPVPPRISPQVRLH